MDLATREGWLTMTGAQAGPQREPDGAGLEQHLCELAAIVEQCGDLVCVTDRDGVIEYVNPAFERTTGYALEEAVGAKPSLLKSGAHDAAFFAALWKALAAGRVVSARFENRQKGGACYFEDKTITPLRDRSGAITHFVSTGKDVTGQVRCAQELQRARRAFALATECQRALRAVTSSEELLTSASRVLLEQGGYRAAWAALAGHDAQRRIRIAGCAGIDPAAIAALCAGWSDEVPGPVATAIRTARITVTGSRAAGANPAWRAAASACDLNSVIAVPIPGESGTLGALVLGDSEAGPVREEEVALLEELAAQIGFGLETRRARGLRERARTLLETTLRVV